MNSLKIEVAILLRSFRVEESSINDRKSLVGSKQQKKTSLADG